MPKWQFIKISRCARNDRRAQKADYETASGRRGMAIPGESLGGLRRSFAGEEGERGLE